MADDAATDEIPPPPPPTDERAQVRPPLRRSRTDRIIGGVCGGIGHHFGVDPILVRIAFVVLAFFGGSGLLLYLVAWLVIAEAGEDDSAAVRALRGGSERSNRRVAGVVVLLVAVALIGGPFVWATGIIFGEGLVIPLLLVAAGVALLVWPDETDGSGRAWLADPASRAQARTRVRDDFSSAAGDVTESFVAIGDELGATRPASTESELPPPPPPQPVWQPEPEPRPPRPRPFIGPLTLAVLLIFTGGAIALDQTGVIDIDPAVALAISLTIVGVSLTVTTFVGRARGLIVLGVLLLPVMWWFHAVDLTWWDGIGEERVVVTSLSDLDDEYRFGIGELEVDLSTLDLDGERRQVAVGLTIGEITVIVPDDVEVIADFDGRIGQIEISEPGGDVVDDGFDPALDRRFGEADGGTLELDVDIGIGRGRLEVR